MAFHLVKSPGVFILFIFLSVVNNKSIMNLATTVEIFRNKYGPFSGIRCLQNSV